MEADGIMDKIMVSIVIPCYNEERNIPMILERFQQAITTECMEVILVNNGSTDNSACVLEGLLPSFPFARSVLVPVNKGYGYGIVQGLKAAAGDFVGWTHADMQTDPRDVVKAYHILSENKWNCGMYVKGNRKGRNVADQFFTIGMSAFETLYLGRWLYDVNAQPNIFSRKFFESLENPPSDFALDLYVLYMAKVRNLQIKRFDVQFPPRIYGSSHWNTGLGAKWKFIKRTIMFSGKMKKAGIK